MTPSRAADRVRLFDELKGAFETYSQEVEGLQVFLLTVHSEPTDEEVRYMTLRKVAVSIALTAYNLAKDRYARQLLEAASQARLTD